MGLIKRNPATFPSTPIYGFLYNWYAVNHASGLAPNGWSIPTNAQWESMRDYLIATYAHINSGNVGGALKSIGNEWYQPNIEGTDEFGFSGIPGGYRNSVGEYYHINDVGYYWSSTEQSANAGIYWYIHYYYGNLFNTYDSKKFGLSVRCVQSKGVGESDGDTGTLTDIEGNEYGYVVIGTLRWMSENLQTTLYRNGDSIPIITDNTNWGNDTTGARCAYDNFNLYA